MQETRLVSWRSHLLRGKTTKAALRQRVVRQKTPTFESDETSNTAKRRKSKVAKETTINAGSESIEVVAERLQVSMAAARDSLQPSGASRGRDKNG